MANPYTGEVPLTIDGQTWACKLTLGALAELETQLQTGTLMDLVQRFETSRFTAQDILQVIIAGLRGAGWQGDPATLRHADIAGGPVQAAECAARLLAHAFVTPK